MRNVWSNYAKACVAPAVKYFDTHFNGSMKEQTALLESFSLFHPVYVNETQPSAEDLNILGTLPIVVQMARTEGPNNNFLGMLKRQLQT